MSAPADDRPIILILGPTAGGKTSLAIELATRLPGGGEIIGCDSMQIYRRMDIGTAKPTAAERAAAPHHLIDLVEPDDDGFTVESWLVAANETIAAIRSRQRWPIIAGGTNLYVQALLYGLDDGPAADPAVRAELAALDPVERRRRLEAIDPESAARIHANDERRTIRALEVHALTGEPLSALQTRWAKSTPRPDVRIIGLDWPAESINPRINQRVRTMVADGLIDEVRRLATAGAFGQQSREALGYRQLLDAFDGRMTEDEAIEQIKIRTRRYAKQQRTWLRRFRILPQARFLAASELEFQSLVTEALIHAGGDDSSPPPLTSSPGGR